MRQDARENRERILTAAEAVFGAHGATGSTEEVARRAGVGIATVFRHFPTKEALIETGATKLTLASMLADRNGFPDSAAAASNRLKAAANEVLRRAQDSGAVR